MVKANLTSSAKIQSDAIFESIKDRVAADPAKAKSINAIYLYKITVDGKPAKEWSEYFFLLFINYFNAS